MYLSACVYPWQVKWFDNCNMICSFSPLATLWTGATDSISGGKLPLNRHVCVHVVIVYPWRVKWSDNGNNICSFSPLAALWNGAIHPYSASKSLNRGIWVHVVMVYILDEWSDLIMVTWFAPFPQLLHREIVWFNHTQQVSCLWIDVFERT